MTFPGQHDINAAVTRLSREESGRVLALLARRFGSLDLADEAVQDALVTAVERWRAGIPDSPAAWLYAVARNNAIDRLRRAKAESRRLARSAHELTQEWEEEPDMVIDESTIGDEQLRLMLLCCHPALDRDTQVALTLRLVGGLTTPEIAAAFLVPEATLAQRIVRAKRKIRTAGIPLTIPAELDTRVDALLTVLYLVFNEGYLSRGATDDATRVDLTDQALRLTRLALELLPAAAEVEGLLALELFHRARLGSRVDGAGNLVLLEQQDRSTWDLAAIEEGNAVLGAALRRMSPGSFQVQALIASKHANARTAVDTDWPAIVSLYTQLERMSSNPVVSLNRAVAVAMADGPLAGLAILDTLRGLDDYHLYHSTRGELLLRAGEPARASFERALELAVNPAERRHLAGRVAAAASAAV